MTRENNYFEIRFDLLSFGLELFQYDTITIVIFSNYHIPTCTEYYYVYKFTSTI